MIPVLIGCTAFVLILGLLLLITHKIVKGRFYRVSYPKGPMAETLYPDYAEQYPRTPISFLSGKNLLHGYIYGAENTKGLLVFAHGIGAGHECYLRDLLWMVDHGWRVLAYDATGSCESEGEGTVGLVQSALDLDAALTYIESQKALSALPVCLMGHSWGGYAVSAGLYFSHNVTASASIAGYARPLEMMLEFSRKFMGKGVSLLAPFVWIEQKFIFGKYASLSAMDGINRARIPVLLIHGTEDEVISVDRASVVAHKDEIVNPHVETLLLDACGQAGHGSIFRHRESVGYIESVDSEYKSTSEAHGGVVPEEVKTAFFKKVDKMRYNRPNEELLLKIDDFFSAAMKKKGE
ncbi:MAG: alpha/beta hydrolase [Ruminococcaceae bacterium]|nr:alpha/beta hydrolase [Oscillospiraceae bacterium]